MEATFVLGRNILLAAESIVAFRRNKYFLENSLCYVCKRVAQNSSGISSTPSPRVRVNLGSSILSSALRFNFIRRQQLNGRHRPTASWCAVLPSCGTAAGTNLFSKLAARKTAPIFASHKRLCWWPSRFSAAKPASRQKTSTRGSARPDNAVFSVPRSCERSHREQLILRMRGSGKNYGRSCSMVCAQAKRDRRRTWRRKWKTVGTKRIAPSSGRTTMQRTFGSSSTRNARTRGALRRIYLR